MGRNIEYQSDADPSFWLPDTADSAAWAAMAHSAIRLAYVISRFEARGLLTVPAAVEGDLTEFRRLRADWITA